MGIQNGVRLYEISLTHYKKGSGEYLDIEKAINRNRLQLGILKVELTNIREHLKIEPLVLEVEDIIKDDAASLQEESEEDKTDIRLIGEKSYENDIITQDCIHNNMFDNANECEKYSLQKKTIENDIRLLSQKREDKLKSNQMLEQEIEKLNTKKDMLLKKALVESESYRKESIQKVQAELSEIKKRLFADVQNEVASYKDSCQKAVAHEIRERRKKLLSDMESMEETKKRYESEIRTLSKANTDQIEQIKKLEHCVLGLQKQIKEIKVKNDQAERLYSLSKENQEKNKVEIPVVVWKRENETLKAHNRSKKNGFMNLTKEKEKRASGNGVAYHTDYRETMLTCRIKIYDECIRVPFLTGACMLKDRGHKVWIGKLQNCENGTYHNKDRSLYYLSDFNDYDVILFEKELDELMTVTCVQIFLKTDFIMVFSRFYKFCSWFCRQVQIQIDFKDVRKKFNRLLTYVLEVDKQIKQKSYQAAFLSDRMVTLYGVYGCFNNEDVMRDRQLDFIKDILSGNISAVEKEAKEFGEQELILEESKNNLNRSIQDIKDFVSLIGEKSSEIKIEEKE